MLFIKQHKQKEFGIFMKVTIINGQNHRGSTYQIGRILALSLTQEENITEFFLPRDLPKFCGGCNQCFLKSETLCLHYAYTQPITEALDAADVMIFTTPVYVYHCTGSMKAFLDHYAFRWMLHRPNGEMFHKQAVCISTAAGAGMKSACKDIKDSMFFWGVGKTHTYGVAVKATCFEDITPELKNKIHNNMESLAKKIKLRKDNVTPSLKTKGFFQVARILNKKDGWNPVDVAYWKNMGWNEKVRPWHRNH